MNEQNNNNNTFPTPVNNTPSKNGGMPSNEPVGQATPISTPQPVAPTPVESTPTTPTPITNQVPVQPSPEPTPTIQPTINQMNQTMPGQTPTPVTPIPEVSPIEQQTVARNPIASPTNVVEPAGPTPLEATRNPQPTSVVSQQTIEPTSPLNPPQPTEPGMQVDNNSIVNNNTGAPLEPIPTPMKEPVPSVPTNGIFAPSIPIGGATDATNVGFVAATSDIPKKKNKGLIATIIIVIIVILAALGYFVIYPYIMKTYFSNPKNVYETTIKNAFKGLNTTANDLVHNRGIYNIEASFNSNIETLKDYAGYTYGINFGVDPTKKTLQEGLYIKNNSTGTEHSYYSYLKDNKLYDKYSSHREYIYLGEVSNEQSNSLFKAFNIEDIFKTSNNLNSEDTNYVINKISDLLIESIDESKLSKEEASISVNGETLKVTNNKYEIDYDTAKKMIEYIRDGLVNDNKAIEIISKMTNTNAEKITSAIKNIKIPEKKEEFNNIITTSIYTYGNKKEIIGFAASDSNEKIKFYYYSKNNLVEAKATINYQDEYSNKTETIVYKITSTKEKDYTKLTLTTDTKDINDSNKGKEIITLDIKNWNNTGIDFDYTVKIEEETVTGNFKLINDVNNNRAKYNFGFTVKNGNDYIEGSLNLSNDWTSEVAYINTDNAAMLSTEEITNHRNEFRKALLETPIGKALTTVSGEYDPSISDYYNQITPAKETDTTTQEESITPPALNTETTNGI